LKAQVAQRRFREDLYFRLSVFPITVPPLRERRQDIPTLARYFVERFCREMKKKTLVLSPQAIEALQNYPWPGNVRELQNCIERAVILTEGDTIHPRHLNLSLVRAEEPSEASSPWSQIDLSGTLVEVTRRVGAEAEARKIRAALAEVGEDRGRASEILGISYKALLAKMKEHGI
jgi:DNA-binding NtrC family response regulator